MRLATVRPPGWSDPVAAQIVDGLAVPFPPNWTVERLLAVDAEDRPPPRRAAFPVDEVELLAPVPVPGAIFGIGRNYAAHAAEMGGAPLPPRPTVFAKLPRTSTAPGGPVRMPAASGFVDYEGELAVVIGRGGKVAGFAVADDVTARDLQYAEGDQWTRGKGADTFCPWGPWITTVDEVPDPRALTLRTYVNGELRQEASTADLIFGIDELVAHIAEITALQPGDLILTGTPEGVGWGRDPRAPLVPGDRVRVEIDLLGAIEHEFR